MNNEIGNSRILAEVQETAAGSYQAGVISKRRMYEQDALNNLVAPALGAARIKTIRENSKVGQAVFAAVLNISVFIVKKWEIGEKKPSGP